MKKIILTAAVSALAFSASTFAAHSVPCAAYLSDTVYSHGVDKTHHETFLVTRKIKNGISQERYIFPNGKISHGQSRVVPGKNYCASYAKHWGKYVQYATYVAYKEPVGFVVHVTYGNGDKERFHVYPMTKIQFTKALK